MDGALDTYWRPGALDEEGSFWEVRYDQPVTLGDTVEIALMSRGSKAETVIGLTIETDAGTTTVDAQDNPRWQTVPVAAGDTRSVRIAVAGGDPEPTFGIREARLPGEGTSPLAPAGWRFR